MWADLKGYNAQIYTNNAEVGRGSSYIATYNS